uniref:Chitin-binding type-2 domain-containing protein n=1 Tax=Steinernema glaseri TaxID=37863 RepID=A0A1I8AML2_9BILA
MYSRSCLLAAAIILSTQAEDPTFPQLNFGQQPLDDPGYRQPAFPQPIYPSRPAARPQEPLFPQLRPSPAINNVVPSPPQPRIQPPAPKKEKVRSGYEINYCNSAEFPEDVLKSYSLAKLDYFIYNTSCSKIFFQCSIGQTFMLKCPGEDQAFDKDTSNCNFRNSVKYCPEYDHVMHCSIKDQCGDKYFACCATSQCIDYSKRCDGHPDCFDGEDENNCPSCARDEFACVKSGKCIDAAKRCDGVADDCADGTNLDELGCTRNTTCIGKFVCDSLQSRAKKGYNECIDIERHCDGKVDCPGGEDERNCKVNETEYLLCENQKESVLRKNWCDGNADCSDRSDEKYCY